VVEYHYWQGCFDEPVSPGYVATDLNNHSGYLTPEHAAQLPVRIATQTDSPTGQFIAAGNEDTDITNPPW
jgi:hypothetical protein